MTLLPTLFVKKHTVKNFNMPKREHFDDIVVNYIRKHPNCQRSDLYVLCNNEGTVRASVTRLLKSKRLRECLVMAE